MVSLKRLTMFFTLKDRSDEVRIHASKVPYLDTACLHRACHLLRLHRVYFQRRASTYQKLACMYIEVSGPSPSSEPGIFHLLRLWKKLNTKLSIMGVWPQMAGMTGAGSRAHSRLHRHSDQGRQVYTY